MPINIPTSLTWLRILMIPVFVGVYYLPDAWLAPAGKNWLAMTVFAVAAITDWLDGWLARRLGLTSAFGAFLDPVADKLMVAAALIVLVNLDRIHPVVAIIIIVIQQVQNNIVAPMVMRRAVGLNPVVSILAFLVGAKLFGAVGAIFAIPVATACSVAAAEYVRFRNES